jgi:hypothetical protein
MSFEGSSNDEVGYLLLEDCELLLNAEGLEREQWLNVEFRRAEEVKGDTNDAVVEGDVCPRGSIIIERNDDDGSRLKLENWPRFDGTMKDVPHSSRCAPCCKVRQGNRSDAPLLVGLAMAC